MDETEIKQFVEKYERKQWYYPYNFHGIEVRPELKNDESAGANNWLKIHNDIHSVLNKFDKPFVIDIGCNMGLYALWMERFMRAKVLGIDLDVAQARFFQRFIRENCSEQFDAEFMASDVTKNRIEIPSCDVITMFCVLYHLTPKHEWVLDNLPYHEYLIVQCNLDRVKSAKRKKKGDLKAKLATPQGVQELLEDRGYSCTIHEYDGYSKPLVIGKK